MATTRQPLSHPPSIEGPGTVVGPGIRVHGRITGDEDLQVEGHVEGSIELTEALYVAREGTVVAEVRARDVVVAGVVIGNVNAEDSITLEAAAKVVGDLAAPRVIVNAGAVLRGRISMSGAIPAPPRARERRAVAGSPAAKGKAAPPRPRAAVPAPPAPRSARAAAAVAAETTPRPSAPLRPTTRQEPLLPEPHEDETVVVRHAEVDEEGFGDGREFVGQSKKKAKKVPRVPKPGKRRVTRRS